MDRASANLQTFIGTGEPGQRWEHMWPIGFLFHLPPAAKAMSLLKVGKLSQASSFPWVTDEQPQRDFNLRAGTHLVIAWIKHGWRSWPLQIDSKWAVALLAWVMDSHCHTLSQNAMEHSHLTPTLPVPLSRSMPHGVEGSSGCHMGGMRERLCGAQSTGDGD